MEARKAQQLDPYSFLVNHLVGQELILARRADEAMEQARRLLDISPERAHMIMGHAYEQKGDLEQAISEFQQVVKLGKARTAPPSVADLYVADLAHAYAVSGRKREALQLLAELTETSKRRHVPSWAFAIVYTGLGDKDRAFESLEKGYDERPSAIPYLKVEPRMESLRSDPRYQELLRRMGLPP